MKRKIMCAAALAMLAVAADARAADTLRIGKASPSATPMVPVEVAKTEGIFAKHGIDATISDLPGGAKLHQAMAAGSIDIGVGAGPEFAFLAKGSPEIAIANPVGPPRFVGIAVPAGSTVKSVDDLKGTKMAVTTINSLTYWLSLELARQKGWGPEGLTPVAIGGESAAMVAAFRTGSVASGIVPTSLAFEMEADGTGRLLLPASQYCGNLSAATIYASKAIVASNPDLVRRFMAAWFDTIDFMRANKDETVKALVRMNGFKPEADAKEYDLTISMFNNDAKFDAESVATLQRSFKDLKLLDSPPDMSKLYTEEFLPKR